MTPTQPPAGELEGLLTEVEAALSASLYYMAVVLALMIPDICGALASADGVSSGLKYKNWYNANLASQYPSLSAHDCYKLRCGVVHQGRLGHPDMQYSRVLFTLPNAQNNHYHNNIVQGALNLDAACFCRDVTDAARRWYAAHHNDSSVRVNLPHLVRFRPEGISPYMVGMPLIA